jgi:anti-sigma regulatory factor (Ser/Thr protein kinase)
MLRSRGASLGATCGVRMGGVTLVSQALSRHAVDCFRHEAVFYDGIGAFAQTVLPFVREGVTLGEPVLVAVPPDRIEAVEEELGAASARVSFVDISDVGRNPARIIGVWKRFVAEHRASPSLRGIGEPVWAGRRAVEIEECHLHEGLLNVAFDDGPAWRLMCPYDARALPEAVLGEVLLTHPAVGPAAPPSGSRYQGHARPVQEFSRPLPPAPTRADEIPFGPEDLAGLRSVVTGVCRYAGMQEEAVDDLVLAAHELATNSVMHGGGRGVLRAWADQDSLVVEVSDSGVIENPLVGREPSPGLTEGGRGVWMSNQLCDLVQVRSSARGTVVRLHAWL